MGYPVHMQEDKGTMSALRYTAFRVIVDNTKHASHTYRVMVDSMIKLSVSFLITPNMHRILTVLWLIAPKRFPCHG